MISITEHLGYLLTCHDCVSVPGWGAFIANYTTACYNQDRQVMCAPRRVIGFNASVNHNDGLLAQSLMRRELMTYERAMRFIDDSVTTWRQQLAAGEEVSLGRLGYFSPTATGAAQFVPFFHLNPADCYFGLDDIRVKTVATLESEREANNQQPTAQPALTPELPRQNVFTRRATRIAASVAVLLGLGVLLSTPVIVHRDNHELAATMPTVTAPQAQTIHTVTASDGATDAMTLAGVGNDNGRYYMIIASLRNEQELQAFKKQNPNLVPYMKTLNYKGLTCVYVARSDSYSTLMELRNQLPEQYRDVWIHK